MNYEGPWRCDTCGQLIEEARDGWVEWVTVGIPTRTCRDLRLVHSAGYHVRNGADPRKRNAGKCQFNERREYAKDGGTVADMGLDSFQGPDGLTYLLEKLCDDNGFTREEIAVMIMRIHVPGYDVAGAYFNQAISDGEVEPNMRPKFYRQSQIDRVVSMYVEGQD